MDETTPPKRITRARAAAKTVDAEPKTTKIATAASKAKLTRSTTTTKRKTRSDEAPESEGQELHHSTVEPEAMKTTRGRSKKTAVQLPDTEMEEAPVPAKATRGRSKKMDEVPPASAAPRSTRGRAKQVDEVPEEAIVVEEPPKRAPRTRNGTASKATAPKKTVKFEEPDKENVVPPPANAKSKTAISETGSGLRAKPVRRTASTTTRATRGRAKAVEEQSKKSLPLSPKKATQVAKVVEPSDDELATNEKTPMKPLMKSPIKPPTSIIGVAKKLDFTNSITCNKAVLKDMGASTISSPARRPPQSPLKDSLNASPHKLNLGPPMTGSLFKLSHSATHHSSADASFKASLLQSPARRPQSPTKVTEHGSPSRSQSSQPIFGMTPKAPAFKISRFATPRTVIKNFARTSQMVPPSAPPKMSTGVLQTVPSDVNLTAEPALKFSGRLSSIMPREDESNVPSLEAATEEAELRNVNDVDTSGDPMILDEVDPVIEHSPTDTPSTSNSLSNYGRAFKLRQEDGDSFQESDSEDELAAETPHYSPATIDLKTSSNDFETSPVTPTPFQSHAETSRTPVDSQLFRDAPALAEKLGFTPLATQLSQSMAPSLEMMVLFSPATEIEAINIDGAGLQNNQANDVQPSPAKSTYFEDAMSMHDDVFATTQPVSEDVGLDGFPQAELDEEDFALAQEADEMSLLEADRVENVQELDAMFEQPEATPSEASQEYGDENAIPLDPALFSPPAVPDAPIFSDLTTPKRVFTERLLHTVSKVPLKPAAEDSTPMRPPLKKRSATSSRLPVLRPTNNLKRNHTVISYSPTKSNLRNEVQLDEVGSVLDQDMTTPSKAQVESWSTVGTPARTPRRDLNTKLLQGAVVFVDVHTTEGADASVLFTELLTQMGARCVKSWTWNSNEEGSKIGITHVVFKDGSKRTLERVREANGVVSCVGVGWVLDCERENKWLPESAYIIDTAIIPRGGHRRRKSMEPRALANLNGTLVPSRSNTPSRHTSSSTPASAGFLPPNTPLTSKSRRRDTMIWEHTPSSTEDYELHDVEIPLLTPVPATPAPETISAYAEEYLDNEGQMTPGGQTPYFLHREELVQKTAPVQKRNAGDGEMGSHMGSAFLPETKDQSVMSRLMAARRKSLQFAPKVGSPLAKGSVF